jgi:hypothetical protein
LDEYAALDHGGFSDKVCYTCGRMGCTVHLYSDAGPLPDLSYIRLERYYCSDHEDQAVERKHLIDSQRREGMDRDRS